MHPALPRHRQLLQLQRPRPFGEYGCSLWKYKAIKAQTYMLKPIGWRIPPILREKHHSFLGIYMYLLYRFLDFNGTDRIKQKKKNGHRPKRAQAPSRSADITVEFRPQASGKNERAVGTESIRHVSEKTKRTLNKTSR